MTKHNGANERVKRDYYRYLKEAKGRDDATIDAVAKSLSRFEELDRAKEFVASTVNRRSPSSGGWRTRLTSGRESG